MAKVQRLSELSQSLPFTEYDFYGLYQKTFESSELGRMKRVLPLRHPHRQRCTLGGAAGTSGTTGSGSGLAKSLKRIREGVLSPELPANHAKITRLSTKTGGCKQSWPQKTEQNRPFVATLNNQTTVLVKQKELNDNPYSKLYNNPSTGLRFFTVYGPAGCPDMAYFGFTNKLLKGETIQIYNYGNCRRDFTYVDDIVEGIVRVMAIAPEKRNGEDGLPIPPYAVYNIGSGQPENLLDFVKTLQEGLLRAGVLPQDYDFEVHKQLVPMQPGDVPTTYADATALERDFGFTPKITLREGLRKFAEWYKGYYF